MPRRRKTWIDHESAGGWRHHMDDAGRHFWSLIGSDGRLGFAFNGAEIECPFCEGYAKGLVDGYEDGLDDERL